jgi:ABC-type transporter Mla subunit MlaD
MLVMGILRELRKVGKACEDTSGFLQVAKESCAELTSDTHTTLGDIDRLVSGLANTAEHIDKVAEGAERLVSGAHVAATVAKTLRATTAGLVSVLEGVKQGIKTLHGSDEINEGGTQDEQ